MITSPWATGVQMAHHQEAAVALLAATALSFRFTTLILAWAIMRLCGFSGLGVGGPLRAPRWQLDWSHTLEMMGPTTAHTRGGFL